MEKPHFFRYDVIGVNNHKEVTEFNNLLTGIEDVLQVSLNNEYTLVYIEMTKIITVQEFNCAIQPKFKLENEVNMGFLMRFFP